MNSSRLAMFITALSRHDQLSQRTAQNGAGSCTTPKGVETTVLTQHAPSKNRTASLSKLSWSRMRIRTTDLCSKSSWMKTPRWREYRGLPKWWCGCRRFPEKFTACSQITSMIHFVLREKTTRCTGSSMSPVQVLRTSGRNSSGTADSTIPS